MLTSVNPATSQIIATHEEHSPQDVNAIAENTATDQLAWAANNYPHRAGKLGAAAEVLRKRSDEYALMITSEMGKPINQSYAEIEKCARVCEYYAKHAEVFLSNDPVKTEASHSYIAYRPMGVIFAVMPWNFPFWQVFRFAAPALMAGNGILLKHASNVTGSALAIEALFREAGLPGNLFRVLKLAGSKAGDVVGNQHVKGVTITGSVAAGRSIATKAGAMLKKSVLELGGSDPYLILEDADLELAASVCANSRLINSGQSCIAAKRFIVVKPLRKAFEEAFVKEMQNKHMCDPSLQTCDVGPQATIKLRDELHAQVTKSIAMGADCLLGGTIPHKEGAWYPPTVLTNVIQGMPVYYEETFGPAAAVIEAANENDAIRIANDTVFGLGAAVFTKDEKRGQIIAEELLNAGCCFVNAPVQSDPRLPFGGIGDSGYGRELSYAGIREFTNIKTVYVG